MTISDASIEEVRRVSEANNRIITNREKYEIPEGFGRVIVEYESTGSVEVLAYVKYPSDARLILAHLRDVLSETHFEMYTADREVGA